MEDTEDRLKELIARMVLRTSYWGFLFSLIRRKSSDQFPAPMGVAPNRDGTITLWYNPQYVDKTSDNSILKILEHEGMHLLNQHVPRLIRMIGTESDPVKKSIKIKVWNLASDCCVNSQMKMPKELEICGITVKLCFPEKFKLPAGKASEWYYDELMKSAEKLMEELSKCPNCGEPKPGHGDGKDGNGNDKSKDFCTCGEGVGQLADDHSQWINDDVKNSPDQQSLARKLEMNTANTIRESTRSFKQRGTLPAGIEELIGDILNPPKLPYHLIIRKLVKGSRLSKFKPSSTRINRKRTYTFVTGKKINIPDISPFPGKKRDFTFNIGILIDTSGSMGPDDMLEGLSGIKGIIENDKNVQTTVIECDGEIQKEYICKKVKDIDPKMRGRGGTTLGPGLFRFKELNPDIILCFTDGYTENINNYIRSDLPKKIVWVLTPDGSAEVVDRTGYVVRLPK